MKYIQGKDRKQIPLFVGCLDEAIAPDHEIRLIDLFVDSLQLKNFGFRLDHIDNGRPAYHPGDLLKLFLYGYLNRIRSSRTLEKGCHRNLEMMWLLKGLAPDHNTIANFRKDNPEPIRKVFRATVEIAKHFELIGGKLVAGDSTKMRAQNSKKNNFNQKKLAEKLAYIEARLKEFTAALAQEDGDTTELQAKIAEQEKRKAQYEQIQQHLE